MTISEAIIKWLSSSGMIDDVNTNLLSAEDGANTLFKTPTNIVKRFNDSSEYRTEYYTFWAKRSSQIELQRITNNQFMESLESWIDEQNHVYNYPKLDNKRFCDEINVSSSSYLYETDENESIYALTIEIKYRKEY